MRKRIITESGIRDINKLAKRYPKAKIYFHQDLDGVTTAIAMKEYLENNGIDVVDAEIIQYGDKEFAIKSLNYGAHIFIEKTLAENIKDAEEIIELAKKNKKKI